MLAAEEADTVLEACVDTVVEPLEDEMEEELFPEETEVLCCAEEVDELLLPHPAMTNINAPKKAIINSLFIANLSLKQNKPINVTVSHNLVILLNSCFLVDNLLNPKQHD